VSSPSGTRRRKDQSWNSLFSSPCAFFTASRMAKRARGLTPPLGLCATISVENCCAAPSRQDATIPGESPDGIRDR